MALVSIITRTKNRPSFLPRVARTIQDQSYQDWQWIIVNDGGETEVVDKVYNDTLESGFSVLVIHNSTSLGMEAASNIGVKNAKGKYIVILDDDDTWEPSFLECTVKFLNDNPQSLGVVTQSSKINEKISCDQIQTLNKSHLNPALFAIHLAHMAIENQFQTNAFLYRKSAFDEVGGYNESMSVLGDWDFNLRMLLLGDVGVIPLPLANYHIRENSEQLSANNSVTGGLQKHYDVDAAYRNAKIREDIYHNKLGLGWLLMQGKQAQAVTKELDRLSLVGDVFHAMYKILSMLKLNVLFRKFGRDRKNK